MKNVCLVAAVSCVITGGVTAQPVIVNDGTGIVNAASYAGLGLPNSSVAQGSIFTIFGSGLGPTKAAQVSSFPLSTSLAGVSISISQGGTTVLAFPLYVSASQINAIIPSDAPLGSDGIVVTFNGYSSPDCPGCLGATVEVVKASLGIFAINQAGSGQGIFTDGKNQLISYTHSATEGEVLNIWATGLGAIQGSDAEPPIAGNVGTTVPVVYVGGVEVKPTYYGRSPCCSGLDQIQFQVPPNVNGCNVPVAMRIGDVISNFVSVALTSMSGSCSNLNGISVADFANLDVQGTIATGYLGLSRLVATQVQRQEFFPMNTSAVTTTTDYAYANFERYEFRTFSLTELPLQIVDSGGCSVYTFNPGQTSYAPPFQVATPTVNPIPGAALDAGTTIIINGPNGPKQIPPISSPFPASVGNYGAELGASDGATPLYFVQGSSYTVTSQGGKDVGPLTAALQVPQTLTWTNQSSMSTITRGNGIDVTWSGADANGYVIISGGALGKNGGGAGFNCTVEPSAGQFGVPSIVLLALPLSGVNESDGVVTSEGWLEVGIATKPSVFQAAGLGIAQAIASFSISQSVTYQ